MLVVLELSAYRVTIFNFIQANFAFMVKKDTLNICKVILPNLYCEAFSCHRLWRSV